MSDLLSALQNELSGNDLSQLAQALGASPNQTQAAIASALPALLSGLANNANSSPDGANALANALDRDHQAAFGSHGGNVLFDLATQMLGAQQPRQAQAPKALDGAGILGHILGANTQSVSNGIANASGMDPKLVSALLPALAPLVMSALGTVKQENNLDAAGVAGYLRQEQQGMAAQAQAADDGFGLDDMVRIGTALHKSGILGKLFG